jgi:hypothetical protein
MEDVLVPLGLWVMIAVIVIASVWGGVQTRRDTHETIRRAIDNGQLLDPRVISSLAKPERSAEGDLRSGVTFTALAIGFALCGVFFGGGPASIEHQAHGFQIEGGSQGFYIAAVIVGSLGVGRLISAYLRRDRGAP